MKIFRNNKVYVQMNDLFCVYNSPENEASDVIKECLSRGLSHVDQNNEHDFIEFEGKKNLEFFKNEEWILDYDELKKLSKYDFITISQILHLRSEKIKELYDSVSIELGVSSMELRQMYELLNHKISSLDYACLYFQNTGDYYIPEYILKGTKNEEPTLINKIVKKLKVKKKK